MEIAAREELGKKPDSCYVKTTVTQTCTDRQNNWMKAGAHQVQWIALT